MIDINSKKLKTSAVIFTWIGPGLILMSFYVFVIEFIERSKHEVTYGVVVRVEGENKSYSAHVRFEDLSGQSFVFIEPTDHRRYDVGERLTVHYPVNEPNRAVLRRTANKNYWGGTWLLLFGLLYSFSAFVQKRVENEEADQTMELDNRGGV
ncbi:hypothetical protein GCM10009007_15110 [Formosimonas limnophila]|uniref:DUF3592 domain-containing protein n=1 Tax=Formosimonas limnophila TaxID=1384487 RepID=A0A8J3CNH6_9BURK|nr:DUF3592 domain-containing protein [Formosimonas limnophila]GHA74988.1 hypothetical protein GCM10009007_15110 [Formosimonas limnophila]